MNRKKRWLSVIVILTCVSCSSWFQSRVDQIDTKIETLRQQSEVAGQNEMIAIQRQVENLMDERKAAMGGALQESKNKQALLMALISLGVGGLKFAAKGVGV